MITVNIDKAKEITKDRLRRERTPLLEALDITYIRKQERNESVTDVVAEKNRLRNITTLADSCQTLEELKSLTCQAN